MRFGWRGGLAIVIAVVVWALLVPDVPLVGQWGDDTSVLSRVQGPAKATKLPDQEAYASFTGTWPQMEQQRVQIVKGVDAYNAADYATAKGILLPLAENSHAWRS